MGEEAQREGDKFRKGDKSGDCHYDRATGWGTFWRGRRVAVLTTGKLGVNWEGKRVSKSFNLISRERVVWVF